MTDAINREDVIRMAKESGFKACVGTTDKEGNYHPFINALSKDIPIEWLERFAALAALRAQPESVCPECHCQFTSNEVTAPGSTRLVNTAQPDHIEQHIGMVAAARAVVERWDTPLWKDVPATAVYINRLRDALPAIGETK